MFSPDGLGYLNKAYRLINAGHDFRTPDSISGIQDNISYARMVLASARKNPKDGNIDIDACVKNLLYVALIIMTP